LQIVSRRITLEVQASEVGQYFVENAGEKVNKDSDLKVVEMKLPSNSDTNYW
jgi:hypothetical protein